MLILNIYLADKYSNMPSLLIKNNSKTNIYTTMKKRTFLWLFAAMTCMLAFTACSSDDDDDNIDDIENAGTGGDEEVGGDDTQTSRYKVSDFLHNWYIDSLEKDGNEFTTSLVYESQGNMEMVKKLRSEGIEFTSSKDGFFWYTYRNEIETEPFTWSLGSNYAYARDGQIMYIKQGSVVKTYIVGVQKEPTELNSIKFVSIVFGDSDAQKILMRYSRKI